MIGKRLPKINNSLLFEIMPGYRGCELEKGSGRQNQNLPRPDQGR